jgi:CelD/BcsL family acetyltransferase involved in cellulose biosynthesis
VIERIRDDSGFRALRQDWSELVRHSEGGGVFLTWEWLYSWWRHLGRGLRPEILAVRESGRLVGLAPLVARGWEPRRLRFCRSLAFMGAPLRWGNVGSDYLDVLVHRDHPQARTQLAQALATEGRVLDLAQVAESGAVPGMVAELRGKSWGVRSAESSVCPVVDLAGHTWDSYLSSRGREHRYTVQRKLKNLRKSFDVFFERARTEDDRRDALRLLIDLHERRWRDKGTSDAFHTPVLREFHEEFTRLALEEGWLRLFVLRLNGEPAAALYALRYGDTFSFYQSGFDPAYGRHGVGVVLMALSIEAAIAEGALCYDMLHGTEEYKFHWANRTRPLTQYALYPPRPQGRIAAALAAADAALRPVARRVLLSQ